LRGTKKIAVPPERLKSADRPQLRLKGVTEHNLKNITVDIPLGLFICVTGVSGSGKSTLVHDVLYKALHNKIWGTDYVVGKVRTIEGMEHVDKVVEIDQSPIGRTPRSNPATYSDLFSHIRNVFSQLPEAKIKGFGPGRFSFNVKGGRCEACEGAGMQRIEMSFLPDVAVLCDVCRGRRFEPETLTIEYRGKTIADVLEMQVSDALAFFDPIPQIRERLYVLNDVGLGYIKLGQSSTTLSGGEAQRIKIAFELCKRATGKTIYLLDEPTTGLHFADIQHLLNALFKIRDQGNTVIVIEHNLDVIKTADHVIDLGPEGGEEGGHVVASGTPEEVAKAKRSYTGQYLKKILQ
jgi:excinuclease ABC subunit A